MAKLGHPGIDEIGLTCPGRGVFEPVISDTLEVGEYVARAIIWKASGTIKFECVDGSIGELTGDAGYIFSWAQITKILATDTTLSASEILCVR